MRPCLVTVLLLALAGAAQAAQARPPKPPRPSLNPALGIWTIPNLLTMVRILLVPVFIMAFLDERMDLAWMLFAVAGLTDGLDGLLARLLNQRSRLGAVLDPLADKLLLDSSYVALAIKGWIPAYVAVMVVSRDIFIVGGMALLTFFGVQVKDRIRPSPLSKANTLAQIGLVLVVLLQQTFRFAWPIVVHALVLGVTVLTAVTAVQYAVRGLGLFEAQMHGDGEG